MQIARDSPNEREQLGYSFKRNLLLGEPSMGLPSHQDFDEFGIRKSARWQQRSVRPLHSLENFRRWRFRQDRLQPRETPVAVDVGHVLRREMKAPFRQPNPTTLLNAIILRQFR